MTAGGSFNQVQCLDDDLAYQHHVFLVDEQGQQQSYTMGSQFFVAAGGGVMVFFDSSSNWQLVTLGCNSNSPVRSLGGGSYLSQTNWCASLSSAMSGILEFNAGQYSVVYPHPTGQLWRKVLPGESDEQIGEIDSGSCGWGKMYHLQPCVSASILSRFSADSAVLVPFCSR